MLENRLQSKHLKIKIIKKKKSGYFNANLYFIFIVRKFKFKESRKFDMSP